MKTQNYRPKFTAFFGAVALAASVSVATAESTTERRSDSRYTAVNTPHSAELKASDRSFFEKASKLGVEEHNLSEVAAERGIHEGVRGFAAQMVNAHAGTNADLKALAARKGVALPIIDENDLRKQQKEWSEKKAKDFDEDYLKKLINAHQDSIDVFEKAVKSDDPDISSFAGQHLSALKQHLAEAKALKEKID